MLVLASPDAAAAIRPALKASKSARIRYFLPRMTTALGKASDASASRRKSVIGLTPNSRRTTTSGTSSGKSVGIALTPQAPLQGGFCEVGQAGAYGPQAEAVALPSDRRL